MKRRLTVTIDADVLAAAREYARSQGVSLSSLVEQVLREAVGETEETGASFVAKWRGAFKLIPDDYPKDDPRFDYLARKYLR